MPAPKTELPLNVSSLISLKTLARQWEVDRSTARRVLREAGIQPVILGRGRNGSIRYRHEEIENWLKSRARAS